MEDLLLVRTPTRPQQSPWNGGRPKRTRRGPQAVRSVGRKDDRVAGAVQRRHHLDGVRIGREPISARPALVPAQRLAVFQVELLGRAVPQVVGSETVHRQVDAVRLAVLHKKKQLHRYCAVAPSQRPSELESLQVHIVPFAVYNCTVDVRWRPL